MRKACFGLLIVGFILLLGPVQTALGVTTDLQDRFDEQSDSRPSVAATNLVGFTITDTSQPVGSIEIQFCSNSALLAVPCTPPAGFDASNAVLSNQLDNTGFTIAASSTSNTIILTRPPATPTSFPSTYQLDNIVSPSAVGTYYGRLSIYPSTDASGTPTQAGGIALSTTPALVVSAEVPPYLLFCAGVQISNNDCSTATQNLIDMGDFSTKSTATASSQFLAATNAPNGYDVIATGTSLTSGTNVINSPTIPTPSLIGADQFGINLRGNAVPPIGQDVQGDTNGQGSPAGPYAIPNRFLFNDGDTIASAQAASDSQTYTVSYITNIASDQPAGVYATTLTYICVGNF